jgi:hypothetical protein
MPKNTVSDPITDQEMAFAHLILSGTMNDRRAAEAAGLNPETASHTKSKPRVRAYMIEHSAAVRERLVDQEADGLRTLNLSRDQILARLWELANLSHEVTRGCLRFAMTPREVTGKTRGQNGVASPFLWGSFIPYNVPV